jgi:hypothetical protein
MNHPRREPVADDSRHLNRMVDDVTVNRGACCWRDRDGTEWRIDLLDGVAVTWCEYAPAQEEP